MVLLPGSLACATRILIDLVLNVPLASAPADLRHAPPNDVYPLKKPPLVLRS